MPVFRYKAVTEKGEVIKEYREFSDLLALDRFASSNKMTLLYVQEVPKSVFTILEIFILQKVKRKDIIELCNNLSLLVSGGLSLSRSIRDITDSTKNKTLKNSLKAISRNLEEGLLLSEAMALHPRVFPEVVINLVKIGEETGDLGKMLKDAADHLERIDEIISNTKRAMIYPSFVLVAMAGAFLFWMLYVLPKVLSMFKTMGIKLPMATRILLTTVNIVNRFWYLMFMPLIFFVIFYVVSRYNDRVKKALHLSIMKVPIMGPIVTNSVVAFFFEYFSLLVSVGITIFRAFEIMEEATGNLVVRDVIKKVRSSLGEGANLQEAFAGPKFFDLFVVRMITVGESTGELDKQLRYIADFYMKKVNGMVDTISKTLEPVVLAGAAVLLLLIILGLLGPVYDMLGKIKG
jgi:type II secretory pathway component PulF